ncbi:MAG: response regulator [Spirochaetales bacterium]|nr:response regulator [Spirochaetales bacterium]
MKSKAKILIVDDEQINLDFFDVMLSKLGFDVEKAEDGEEALEKVRSYKPDLIILDNIMPKISGWEVTRILKHDEEFRDFQSIPIIMFSAMDDVKDKIEGFELGVEDYITKPFNFSEVLARIKAVLRHKDLSDQVIQRERRLALLETLNTSLVSCIQELRKPLGTIGEELEALNCSDTEKTKKFLKDLEEQYDSIQNLFQDMERKIEDMQREEKDLRKHEISLGELEAQYQKHFNALKEKKEGMLGRNP